jgi:hypothetical protein
MALISLGLLAFGAYLIGTHGPLTLALLQLAVGVLGLFLAFRVYKNGKPFEWRGLGARHSWPGLLKEEAGPCGWLYAPLESLLVFSL